MQLTSYECSTFYENASTSGHQMPLIKSTGLHVKYASEDIATTKNDKILLIFAH